MSGHVTVPGVPETITREQYLGLLSAVGFEPNMLRSLEFRWDGIYAEVYATDERGARMPESGGWVGDGLPSDEPAVHRVFVRVVG